MRNASVVPTALLSRKRTRRRVFSPAAVLSWLYAAVLGVAVPPASLGMGVRAERSFWRNNMGVEPRTLAQHHPATTRARRTPNPHKSDISGKGAPTAAPFGAREAASSFPCISRATIWGSNPGPWRCVIPNSPAPGARANSTHESYQSKGRPQQYLSGLKGGLRSSILRTFRKIWGSNPGPWRRANPHSHAPGARAKRSPGACQAPGWPHQSV